MQGTCKGVRVMGRVTRWINAGAATQLAYSHRVQQALCEHHITI